MVQAVQQVAAAVQATADAVTRTQAVVGIAITKISEGFSDPNVLAWLDPLSKQLEDARAALIQATAQNKLLIDKLAEASK